MLRTDKLLLCAILALIVALATSRCGRADPVAIFGTEPVVETTTATYTIPGQSKINYLYDFATSLTNSSGKIVTTYGSNVGTPGAGAALPTWSSSFGGCVYADGSDTIAADSNPINTSSCTALTVCIWVKFDSASGTAVPMCDSSSAYAYVGLKYSSAFYLNLGASSNVGASNTNWNHFAATWETANNRCYYYVNGKLSGTNTYSATHFGYQIGKYLLYRPVTGWYHAGYIDRPMVITNYFWSSTDATNDYVNTKSGKR